MFLCYFVWMGMLIPGQARPTMLSIAKAKQTRPPFSRRRATDSPQQLSPMVAQAVKDSDRLGTVVASQSSPTFIARRRSVPCRRQQVHGKRTPSHRIGSPRSQVQGPAIEHSTNANTGLPSSRGKSRAGTREARRRLLESSEKFEIGSCVF